MRLLDHLALNSSTETGNSNCLYSIEIYLFLMQWNIDMSRPGLVLQTHSIMVSSGSSCLLSSLVGVGFPLGSPLGVQQDSQLQTSCSWHQSATGERTAERQSGCKYQLVSFLYVQLTLLLLHITVHILISWALWRRNSACSEWPQILSVMTTRKDEESNSLGSNQTFIR